MSAFESLPVGSAPENRILRQNPQNLRMKSNRRKLTAAITRGMVFLVVGMGAFYAFDTVDRLLLSPSDNKMVGPLPTIDPPVLARSAITPNQKNAGDRRGNPWLTQSLVQLEQRQSLTAEVVQLGWVGGRLVETHGTYRQVGGGANRQFSLRLQGRLADRPARLTQVSDSRFLWTDLRWGDSSDDLDRSITRVDLRRLRRNEKQNGSASSDSSDGASPDPGRAVASFTAPGKWLRFGGLPLLLASLNETFDFGPARKMQLRGERVVAMVGHWNPEKLRRLLKEGEPTNTIPERAPHHVVVALSLETSFPLMVEYRSADDPMSQAGWADAERLRPSGKPMLKLDFLRPEFDIRLAESEFHYTRPSGVAWRDDTARELQIAERRREQAMVAIAPSPLRR